MPAFLIFIFAFTAPLVLWPIEIFFPYPHIVEELTKAFLIFFLLKKSHNYPQKIYGTILIGFLFGTGENLFYLLNQGPVQNHILRFVLTMPLHVATSIIVLLPALISKKLIFAGIIIAAIIHYFYNFYAASFNLLYFNK